MTSSFKDPLAVRDVGDDDENDGGGPVMTDVCCDDGSHHNGGGEDNKNGPAEKVDVDVRAGKLAPGHLARIPKGQKNTPASHTGPKGVINDFNVAKHNLENVKLMQRLRAEDAVNRKVSGPTNLAHEVAAASAPLAPVVVKKSRKTTADSDGDTDSDLSDLDDDDFLSEAAFAQYKQQRMASVQATLPRYGTHQRVTVDELKAIVQTENEYVFVVCHLYQNHIEQCGRINIAMEHLATQFPHVHFLRIRSTDALPNYPDAGLPTLLVYRNGKQVNQFVRITDSLKAVATKGNTGISDLTLGRFLATHGILKMPTGLDDDDVRQAEAILRGDKRQAMVVSVAGKSVKSGKAGAAAEAVADGATATAAAGAVVIPALLAEAAAASSSAATADLTKALAATTITATATAAAPTAAPTATATAVDSTAATTATDSAAAK